MRKVKLGDICLINMGQSPESSSYNKAGNGLPFFQGNADFGERYPITRVWCSTPTKIAEPGDILISVRAPIGALNISNTKCCIGCGLAALTVKQELCFTRYLWYAISSKIDYLESKGTGSTFKAINKNSLEETEFELPEKIEQQKIASVLDKVSDLIALRKQQLSALDTLAKSQFVEMFGETELTWPLISLGDICSDARTGPFGSALHHDEFVDKGVFVLGIDNAVENKFSYNRMRFITEEKYQQLKRYTVHPGDVIITIMGTIGRSAVIPEDMPLAINTKHLACLTPDYSKVESMFLCSAFQMHPEVQRQLTKNSKGAIMDGLNLGIIKALKFQLPPLQLQRKFVLFIEQIDKSKSAIRKSLDELQLLYDSLMQEYFG